MMKHMLASHASGLPASLISEAVVHAASCGAVNLASGSPDFPPPPEICEGAQHAMAGQGNQYSPNEGYQALREAVAEKCMRFNGIRADPETAVTITCGTAEALFCALFSIIDRGDEVILFEPAFESYIPDIMMAGGVPRVVRLTPPHWGFDILELERLCNERTKAILLNTPHNPTGKVFSSEELEALARLCRERNIIAITDEIYEYLTYDGAKHISMASLAGMAERTITLGGLSKTFNCTGWRIGYAIAAPEITEAIRRIHTYLTVCAPAPLQKGAEEAFLLPPQYFSSLQALYLENRNLLMGELERAGFTVYRPQGAYFIVASFSPFGFDDDREFCRHLACEIGVGAVPLRAFLSPQSPGGTLVRFSFCKKRESIMEAGKRLQRLCM